MLSALVDGALLKGWQLHAEHTALTETPGAAEEQSEGMGDSCAQAAGLCIM